MTDGPPWEQNAFDYEYEEESYEIQKRRATLLDIAEIVDGLERIRNRHVNKDSWLTQFKIDNYRNKENK